MRMSRSTWVIAVFSAAVAAVAPGAVQAQDAERGVVVFASGGGYSPVTDLDEAGTARFKTGFVVGGGLGYQLNRYVVLRGNFNFARSEADTPGFPALNGTKYNRFLYDADVQLRYPMRGGFVPYVFAGGGATTSKQDIDSDPPSSTRGAATFGLGFAYEIPDTRLSLYAQGTGWAYRWDKGKTPAFDKTQVDIAWTAGLSYRLGR